MKRNIAANKNAQLLIEVEKKQRKESNEKRISVRLKYLKKGKKV